ncbi:serine O-acetyltransferase EpsC [Polaromonas sp.]|uniref:serine O-acetyltransferase EpsC n=1 Tax=Polaromonas sp. TaxID=1869339 RepID=UPI003C999AC4
MKKLRLDIERYCMLRGYSGVVSSPMLFYTCFNPRMAPVVLLRLAEFFYERRMGILAKFFSMLNVLIFGIEVSPQVRIGGGLFLPHTVGTVIGASHIGDNCTIMQGVTLGTREPDMGFTVLARPIIGNHVLIGAGAKVIGPIVIGDHVKIGANAVVLCDVPAYALAVGVPAKTLSPQKPDSAES